MFKLKLIRTSLNNRLECYVVQSVNLFRRSSNTDVKTKNIESMQPMNFNEIPGPKSYPVIGTLYKYWPFIGDYDAETLDKNAWLNWRRYGELVREMPLVKLLHVYDPDLIEIVLRQNDRYPARRSHIAMLHYRLSKRNVYNTGGLLATYPNCRPKGPEDYAQLEQLLHVTEKFRIPSRNGPEWWKLRSTFQKKFASPQSAKEHVESTDTVVTEFIQWIKQNKMSQNDFLPFLNKLNLEVIGTIAFNERFQSFDDKEQSSNSRSNKIIAAAFGSNSGIMKLDKGVLWRFIKTPLYKKLASSQTYLEKVSTEILLKKTNFFESVSTEHDKSLLSSFLQQPNLDLKDVRGMMVDILMAAIDTTAYATSFALYHLARNPESQKKFFEEVRSLLPSKMTKITPELLSTAIYVKSTVKESLRLNPVSIGIGRVLQKDLLLKGYLIPEGTVIVTQNMIASRIPQYVKDPSCFKPERWIRGSAEHDVIHPFLSLPFGFGPRSCIARRLAEQNMCITLMRLIREFDIKWMGGDLGVRTLLINKPDQPIKLSFTPRSV